MGKQVRYTSEFKIQTVQTYLHDNLSANQLAIKLGIHPHTVRHWIQDYNDGKMTVSQHLENDKTDSSDTIFSEVMDTPKRSDIGTIISKLSTLECELSELKIVLQAYLFR